MEELDYDYLAILVRKALQGDSSSFAELYAATYNKQFNFAYKYVKDYYTAQDVLQDVYILALKNLSKLKDPRLFISWLNQITFRVCFDYMKKIKAQAIPIDSSEYFEGDIMYAKSESTEKQAMNTYRNEELMSQIMALKPMESQCIIMRYFNDMTIDEIALAMDCSRSTVKRKIASAKDNLRKRITKLDWGDVFDD